MPDAPLYILIIGVIALLAWAVRRHFERERDEENHDTQVPEDEAARAGGALPDEPQTRDGPGPYRPRR